MDIVKNINVNVKINFETNMPPEYYEKLMRIMLDGERINNKEFIEFFAIDRRPIEISNIDIKPESAIYDSATIEIVM